MLLDDGLKVNAGKNVAVKNEDGFVDTGAREFDSSSGAEGIRLDHVANRNSDLFAVSNLGLYSVRLIIEAQNNFVDFWHLANHVDLVAQERPVEDRHNRFRGIER